MSALVIGCAPAKSMSGMEPMHEVVATGSDGCDEGAGGTLSPPPLALLPPPALPPPALPGGDSAI
jgi:hypothetical protein